MTFRVALDDEAGDSEVLGVAAAFRAAGIKADVKANFGARSLDPPGWIVLVAAPVTLFAKAFLEAAGKDAWEALRRFCQSVYAARRPSPRPDGAIVLRGGNHWVVINRGLPDQAYVDFFRLDFEKASYAFGYDVELGQWVNAGKQPVPFVD